MDHLYGDLQQTDERLQKKIKYNTDEEAEGAEFRPDDSKSDNSRPTTHQFGIDKNRLESSKEEGPSGDARSATTPRTHRSIKSKNRNFNEV